MSQLLLFAISCHSSLADPLPLPQLSLSPPNPTVSLIMPFECCLNACFLPVNASGTALGALLTQPSKSSPEAIKPKVDPKSPTNLSGAALSQNASSLNNKTGPLKQDPMMSKFNFNEDSNSPKPAVPSQKPPPPGATFCEHSRLIWEFV
jgi:hypothetical protein